MGETDLRRALKEHDDDMARLDRNTMPSHQHCWHWAHEAASYCCDCNGIPHEPTTVTDPPMMKELT